MTSDRDPCARWRIRARLDDLHIEYFGPDRVGNSLYFHDPDGALLEITRDPLDEMEGKPLNV